MVPSGVVTAWSVEHRWTTRRQVEQDLLLSRAICAIADDPYLGTELVFRGGTAQAARGVSPPLQRRSGLRAL